MKEIIHAKTRRRHTFITVLEIIALTFLVMASLSDAAPFAYITNSDDNTVSVIDTATNTATATVNVGNLPFGVAASPDGKKVYVVNYLSNNVSVIDTVTNTSTATVNVGNRPFGIAASLDGKKLYVANFASNNVSVINTSTNTVISGINAVNCPWGIAVSPDGKRVYTASLNSNYISVIDTTSNTVIATVKVGNGPWGVAVSPDGTKVFVTNSNSNTISVIDSATNTVVGILNVGNGPWGVAVSPDGTKVYAANSGSNKVSVINTSTNTVVATVNVGSLPCGVTVNPQGTKAFVVNSDSNNVSVIDTATNTVIATVNVGGLPVAVVQLIIPSPPTLPVANFKCNITQGNAPLTVQFTDQSKNATGLNWNFGDGTNSIQQNPTHTYSTAGNYTVNLTASNINGTSSKLATIAVSAQPILPVANFSSNVTNGIVPLSVQFTDLSKNVTQWKWDFGDGTNSTQKNPMHTYSVAGNYTVKLTVSNVNGTDSKTGSISVVKEEKTSNLSSIYNNRLRESSPEDILSNYKFIDVGGLSGVGRYRDVLWFDLSGYTSITQINDATLSLFWYYPNNQRTNDTVIEIYRPASTWNSSYVSWNKKDKDIAWSNPGGDWYDKNGGLQGSTPYATLTLNASTLPSNSYCEFDVTNLVREYASGKYPNTGFLIKARSESDNYVAFYSTSCNLCLSTSILPFANFSSNVTGGYAPLTVQFTDQSKNATGLNWNFGDRTNSIQQNPTHTYSTAGNYTVNLTASNVNGTNSKLATITVSAQPVLPVANFSSNVTQGNAPLTVQLTDQSKNAALWNWSFGDGTNSTQQSPMHTYAAAGIYIVNLIASNANGTSSKIATITVSAQPVLPVANFSSNVTNGIVPLSVQFTDLSKNVTQWKWDFGDETNSTQKNPMHTYSVAGNYTVKLTVSNVNGTDSKTGNISAVKEEKTSNLSSIYNSRLRESTPDDVLLSYQFIDVGGLSGVGRYRDVLWFDLSEYTSITQISNAALSLIWYYPNNQRTNDTVIEIYRPASTWNSSYVSWNKKDKDIAWSNPGGDWYDKNGVLQGSTPYATLTLNASTLPSNSYCEFDVTNLVREYASGKYPNTGFLIKARSESDNYVAFYSAQCGNTSEVPKLKLVYS